MQGKAQGAHISFASVDLLWQTLTKKRWEILHAMTGQGELSIRGRNPGIRGHNTYLALAVVAFLAAEGFNLTASGKETGWPSVIQSAARLPMIGASWMP